MPSRARLDEFIAVASKAISSVVEGDRVAIHWNFELTEKSGTVRRFDEIAWQEWRGDRIFRERFFYDQGDRLIVRFRSSCHIGNLAGPHPEEHRASDAPRRMAAGDGRSSCHPSRHKPSPCGQRLVPQDEERERGNDRFHGIARLVANC